MILSSSIKNDLSKNRQILLENGPGFVGVGPEKTGTTWIYRHLMDHPETICSPVKELRYFWENLNYPGENFLSRSLNKKKWYTAQYREHFRKRTRHYLKNLTNLKDRKRLIWDWKYFFSIHNDDWYLSSFDNLQGYITGEVSPQYFFLPEEEIVRISKLLPKTKFIITLRYPPEWAWSFARMMVRLNLIENSDEEVEKFLVSLLEEKSFSKNLQIWKKYVPEDRLAIMFFDKLQEEPYEFFKEICEFLEIQPTKNSGKFAKAVNKGNSLEVPEKFKELISESWKDEIKTMNQLLPNLPESWMKRAFSS